VDPQPTNRRRQSKSKKSRSRLRAELDAGGLAIGMGIQYTPGATRLEVIDMFPSGRRAQSAGLHACAQRELRRSGIID
jgi:hypothetical protein